VKISVVKVIRDLPLSDYAPEMGELFLQVWVNPPRDMIRQMLALSGALPDTFNTGVNADDRLAELYSVILSQGPDEAVHLSPDDLKQMYEEDPALWIFVYGQVWNMMNDHREALQKKRSEP
jgi:hypothetical protein